MTSETGRAQMLTELKELLRNQGDVGVDLEAIREPARIEDVGFDSVSILDFMYEIEGRYEIELDVKDLVEMVTVSDLLDHLEQKLPR